MSNVYLCHDQENPKATTIDNVFDDSDGVQVRQFYTQATEPNTPYTIQLKTDGQSQ
jgi:hypothetical protein